MQDFYFILNFNQSFNSNNNIKAQRLGSDQFDIIMWVADNATYLGQILGNNRLWQN